MAGSVEPHGHALAWVLPTADQAADLAASFLLTHLVTTEGRFRMAVPGGRSPGRIFDWLVPRVLEWERVDVLFADERAVPPDDAESNFRLVHDRIVSPLGGRAPRVVRMRADAGDLEAAAREYESEVATPLDFVLLGLGEDGHVASLFPGSPLLAERERRVAVVRDSPKPPPTRLTLTPRAIAEARHVAVIATGAAKSAAVARALAPVGDLEACPARLVRAARWFVDAEAAAATAPELLHRVELGGA